MNGGVFTLEELFSGKVFVIPDYQRGYSWEKRQWEEFLDDLDFLADGKRHYTGNVVLHQQEGVVRDEEGKNNAIFHVVDGQQRLTTVIILLQSICDHLSESKPVLAHGIRKAYVQFNDINQQLSYKLRLNSDCRDFFERDILTAPCGTQGPVIASHLRLKEAKEYFGKYLREKRAELRLQFDEWLLSLRDKVVTRLIVSQYTVEASSEVGVIFEVMNNRGKQISELEKVKNHLLYLAEKLNVTAARELPEAINATWGNAFQILMASGLTSTEDEDSLLRYHWLTCVNPSSRDWEKSKSVKAKYSLKELNGRHTELLRGLRTYVGELRDVIVPYCEVLRPDQTGAYSAFSESDRADARKWGVKLLRLNVTAPFLPLLIACRLRFPQDGSKYVGLLKTLELFSFRVYKWAQRRSGAGQVFLFQLGHKLFRDQLHFDDLLDEIRYLSLRFCPNKTFTEILAFEEEASWYEWDALKYLLYEYEEHLANHRQVEASWESLTRDPQKTIEHILPQTATDNYWRERFSLRERRDYVHDLGNLCLTKDNSAYQNKSFLEKKGSPGIGRCYANASLFQERELAAFTEWNISSIKQRRSTLEAWIEDRWHMDDSDLGENVLDVDLASDEE